MIAQAGGLTDKSGAELFVIRADPGGGHQRIPVDIEALMTSRDPSLNLSIQPAFSKLCAFNDELVRNCRVRRTDGKNASTKHLACSLSALDAAGATTAVVPVDKKLKLVQ